MFYCASRAQVSCMEEQYTKQSTSKKWMLQCYVKKNPTTIAFWIASPPSDEQTCSGVIYEKTAAAALCASLWLWYVTQPSARAHNKTEKPNFFYSFIFYSPTPQLPAEYTARRRWSWSAHLLDILTGPVPLNRPNAAQRFFLIWTTNGSCWRFTQA